MRKLLTLAAALALIAGPAFASHVHPQTFQNTPDPQAQAPAGTAATGNAKSPFAFYTPIPATTAAPAQANADPMDPNLNPRNLRSRHH